MNNGVVLFEKGEATLWLTGVKRFPDGSIKTGYVVNGDWNFERKNGVVFAKNSFGHIVNRWSDPGYIERPAPKGHPDDYNEVMAKAQEEFK